MEKHTLYKFFSGTATDDEKRSVKLWSEENDENAKELLAERTFFDALLITNDSTFDEITCSSTHPSRRILYASMRWAAILVIALLSSYLYIDYRDNQASELFNTISVPSGQCVNITLSDGSKVFLNAGSHFTYPSLFNTRNRTVSLNGEGFFEVASNQKKPFIVKTELCDIEVTGTKFNVDAYSGTNLFTTSLLEGSVNIINNTNNSDKTVLTPNNQITFNNGNLTISPITDYDIYRWREGLICFNNMPFGDLIKRLEKYYDINIIVENTSLLQHSFSGKFRISDGIGFLLKLLQKDIDYQYSFSDSNKTINIK